MHKQVTHLLSLPQPAQRTEEWYKARENKLTASAISTLLVKDDKTCDPYIQEYNLETSFDKNGKSCNPYADKEKFVEEKCTNSRIFKGSEATFWGQKYEQVACDMYSRKCGQKVLDFGLINHPTIEWLAASPDGIREDGMMLEIKCPFRRKITGIPPFYYWQQVQLQLEVCDLDLASFVEVEFVEYYSLFQFLDDEIENKKIEEKGLLVQIESIPDVMDKRRWIYPPTEMIDSTELIEWASKRTKIENEKNSLSSVRIIYWKTFVYSDVTIVRNRSWMSTAIEVLRKEWEAILKRKCQYKKSKGKFL